MAIDSATSEAAGTTGPAVDVFTGVRVVELAQWVFVPVAGALLADWGADVVHIEHPETGDGYRGLVSQGILQSDNGINQSMELANRGKRSVGLDVKSADGRAILLKLVERADIFLTNYLPSTLERLRLGVDELREVNPKLIYARGHGFGVRGPDADKAAYDATAFWARGGLGETLTPEGLPGPIGQRGAFGDRNGAVQLAFGMAGALYRRERTGQPSVVDVSLLATAMWTLASDVLSALQGNFRAAPPPGGNSRDKSPNPLVNPYRTKDGRFISLVFLQADRYWVDLCRAVGRPELAGDPRFVDMTVRAENRGECVALLDEIFAARTFEEWRAVFDQERFPWAPFLRVPEIIEDRQVAANGYIGEVAVEGGRSFSMPTGAVQFDERPATLRRGPELGQDTESLLVELGFDWDEIGRLKQAKVIP
jgi:crotonobetainyl-CoA:carnitine CoA-transferase CaiB-like acyl-CoA transferase